MIKSANAVEDPSALNLMVRTCRSIQSCMKLISSSLVIASFRTSKKRFSTSSSLEVSTLESENDISVVGRLSI